MQKVAIIDGARTIVGNIGGYWSKTPVSTMGALVLSELYRRNNLQNQAIDLVILGNILNFDYNNIARIASLEAGFPVDIPNITVNMRCASALTAITQGAMLISSGKADLVIAGGIESYSHNPYMMSRVSRAYKGAPSIINTIQSPKEFGNQSLLETAENVAKYSNIGRNESDEWAFRSHAKALSAWESGFFDPYVIKNKDYPEQIDECIRKNTTIETLSKLEPVIAKDGVVTAGNASPMNDGAAMILMASDKYINENNIQPLGYVGDFSMAGIDPAYMGLGPVVATNKLLKDKDYTVNDYDLIEINEAFACQTLACIKEMKIDNYNEKVNIHGGAIAIGHPNSASGAILTLRMLYLLREYGLDKGLVSFCVGGGLGFSLEISR